MEGHSDQYIIQSLKKQPQARQTEGLQRFSTIRNEISQVRKKITSISSIESLECQDYNQEQ